MKISLIINTASMDPRAAQGRNPWRTTTYGDRVSMVHKIVNDCQDFDEIIVAGVFEPSAEGLYTYVSITQQYGDRRDALLQREIGARHATGDILVFTHDDHKPDFRAHLGSDDDSTPVLNPLGDWDILVPKRIHGVTGEELNNGKVVREFWDHTCDPPRKDGEEVDYDHSYMGGHTLCMKREAWAAIPWVTAMPPRSWDIPMTRIWQDAGLKIVWTDELLSIDLEAAEHES